MDLLAPREPAQVPEDAVQLMTIHAAKGLEFPYVFVVRVRTTTLPRNYSPPLVEFPRELRNYETVMTDDAKTLDQQEQRRMFYVAMTRAEDMLYACGKAGSAKKQPVPPSKYLRELVDLRARLNGSLECRMLPKHEVRVIHAGAAPALNISQWMELPPRADARLHELSASAVDRYDRCPLAYKLRWTGAFRRMRRRICSMGRRCTWR